VSYLQKYGTIVGYISPNHSWLLEFSVNPSGSDITFALPDLCPFQGSFFHRSDSEEVDCVWIAYCHQLNLQAEPGGISSTVARINSVGLKLALRQLVII